MRAWPLNQPHAGLVVSGKKCVETRPRPCRTLVGERVVIHANLTQKWDNLRRELPSALDYSYSSTFGALIGTVMVLDCVQMTAEYVAMMRQHPAEYVLGDYKPGRWAFALSDPRPFTVPVPWKGKQGVFMVPDQVVATAECERCSGGVIIVPAGCFSSELRPCPACRAEEARSLMVADVFRETGIML